MSRLTLLVFVAGLGAGVGAPAAAGQLRANPVSVSPNEDPRAGEPVLIVFQLSAFGPSPRPRVARVDDVEVVLRGEGETRRFPAEDLGSGRYRTEVVFPKPGGWELRVSYGADGEIQLGKGAARVVGSSVDGPRKADGPLRNAVALVLASVFAIVVVAAALPRRRRRVAPIA